MVQKKPASASHSRRIFIGLWPDATTMQALGPLSTAALEQCKGRPLLAHQWHITLAFLGELSLSAVDSLCARAQQWALPSAPFLLDRYGCFADSRIVWVGSEHAAAQKSMAHTHAVLWQQLEGLGYTPEPRAFVPHVSLLRQAQSFRLELLPKFVPFAWQSASCQVVASSPRAGATHYECLAHIPLY